MALQSSIAAAITFTVVKYFDSDEIFLAILSAVLVVERSIGNTINHAKGRVLATVVGSGIGFAFVTIIPTGYATIISLVVTMFVMNAIASFKPSWRYGVVASVAISLGAESDALQISLDRLLNIGIGITIGLIVTAVIWPEKASDRARKHLRSALNIASNRFEIAFKNTRTDKKEDATKVANNFHSSLGNAKNAAGSIRFGKKNKINNLIDATEKLYNSILIIHRVSDSKDTTLLDDGDESVKNAEDFNQQTCEIIKTIVNNDRVEDEKMETFKSLVRKIKKNINDLDEDKNQTVFRNAFIFGIEEIQESLFILEDILESD